VEKQFKNIRFDIKITSSTALCIKLAQQHSLNSTLLSEIIRVTSGEKAIKNIRVT